MEGTVEVGDGRSIGLAEYGDSDGEAIADHLVPLDHGEHQAELVPDSELRVRPREGHMGSLDAADEILDTILGLWRDRKAS